MRQLQMSPRLKFIATIIKPHKTFADIGTDHGYLPLILFENHKIRNALLCDINQGPLNNAKNTFSETPYTDQVSYRLGSGLSVIDSNEIDAFTIAGMGGTLIQMILEKDQYLLDEVEQFVLQPMTEQSELRQWLIDHAYCQFMDYFVIEGDKIYEIISYEKNESDLELLNQYFDISKITSDKEFGYHISYKTLDGYKTFMNMKSRKYHKILHATSSLSDTNEKRVLCFDKLSIIENIQTVLKTL